MHIVFLCAPYNPCVFKLTWTLLVTPTPPQLTRMHILLRVSTCVQVAFSVGLSFSRFWFGGSVPPSQFHRAPCASCKFAAFTGVHAFSVSTQLTLRNLTVRHIFHCFQQFHCAPHSFSLFTSLRPGLCVLPFNVGSCFVQLFHPTCTDSPSRYSSPTRYTESRTLTLSPIL